MPAAISNNPPTQPIGSTQLASLGTWLQAKGCTAANVTAAIGTDSTKTAQQVEQRLTAWLKTLPKGS